VEVSKDSKFTLSLESMATGVVTLGMIIGMWFTLQSDIEEAKELPKPEVSRTEYDLKDQMIRDTIMNTQDDVEEIKEDVKNIERIILENR